MLEIWYIGIFWLAKFDAQVGISKFNIVVYYESKLKIQKVKIEHQI